ncbi:pimeloyl-ACP methyl ester carboxylesterase [Rhizobium sp. BK529]|uniref:alpha/beta fold hydrolase n=1 Tax=unclassified Rhizobium TaxID=2613769 RepID=UPI00105216A5|nr:MULTISPECIES: alpha/beta hydrolase [unclassified Rhizobium]MBB3595833.1 pimeloyl-ACP methyl ester carboxylesterase [Rhizobium sp. BK529]TCR95142.1 pimeloyl-ACP methyl ester carboxylesterase [Rhizobium sp. BK418]
MATAIIDGISTRYEVIGNGPPLLMFSPGGFDATIEKWRTQGIYEQIQFLEQLPSHFTCILFDRRETGQSGGRVERVTWQDYVAQATGLLDHLGIEKAHIMGGCMGCSVAMAFATEFPERVDKMVLFWPVGGARYRMTGHQRFAEHLAFVQQNGLEAVVALARESNKAFGADPRGGPWVSVLRHDKEFAERYISMNVDHYKAIIAGMPRGLIDRDTSPGADPEDLVRLDIPTLIVPGADFSHATSAARYIQECIPGSDYWDIPVPQLSAENTNARVIDFLKA